MKKLVLLLVIVFTATTLIGCGKKKKDEGASMEGLNGVVSENVVSITEPVDGQTQNQQAAESIPVVVDNVENAAQFAAQEAAPAMGAMAEKPVPKQVQLALKNAGFYNGKIDGDIGPKTKKAIEAFQAKNGLKADGKVGAKTWKALLAYLNKAAEVANPTAAAQTIGQ